MTCQFSFDTIQNGAHLPIEAQLLQLCEIQPNEYPVIYHPLQTFTLQNEIHKWQCKLTT